LLRFPLTVYTGQITVWQHWGGCDSGCISVLYVFEEEDAMKSRLILLGAWLALATPAAHAQMTVDFAKITCKQFVISKFARPKSVAYWLSGYYNGKNANTVVDIRGMEQNVHKLETYCRKNYEMTVMDAAKNVLNVEK
jgi:acid stress chaperone HdeB